MAAPPPKAARYLTAVSTRASGEKRGIDLPKLISFFIVADMRTPYVNTLYDLYVRLLNFNIAYGSFMRRLGFSYGRRFTESEGYHA